MFDDFDYLWIIVFVLSGFAIGLFVGIFFRPDNSFEFDKLILDVEFGNKKIEVYDYCLDYNDKYYCEVK